MKTSFLLVALSAMAIGAGCSRNNDTTASTASDNSTGSPVLAAGDHTSSAGIPSQSGNDRSSVTDRGTTGGETQDSDMGASTKGRSQSQSQKVNHHVIETHKIQKTMTQRSRETSENQARMKTSDNDIQNSHNAAADLKAVTEHSDPTRDFDRHAFERPIGNSLGSAINGDANNPKLTTFENNMPAAQFADKMKAKRDDLASRIDTIKEHQDSFAVSDRDFVNQNLQSLDKERNDFETMLQQLNDARAQRQIRPQILSASNKMDQQLRALEQKIQK